MRPQSLISFLALGHVVLGAAAATNGEVALLDVEQSSSDLQARGFVDDLWNKLKTATGCAGCEVVLTLMKGLVLLGDKPLVKVIQGICKLSKAADPKVCDGAVALEAPIVAASLRNMKIGSRASKALCTTLLGACGYPEVAPWSVPFPSPKPARGRPRPSGHKPLKVVHYSDIHVDPLYVAGSSTDCKMPICCRPYTDADKPGKSKSPAGPNGDHKCDAPISLEQSMYNAINEIAPDAAFTIFTGDIIDHAIWNTTEASNVQMIDRAYEAMNQSLRLVYGTAGNHESHPVNDFQPNAVGKGTQWVYQLLSNEWSRWVDRIAAENAAKTGAYSVKHPNSNLRIISLNTNVYYKHNFWMYYDMDDKDPNLQIAWLVRELDAAEKAGENVYIIGHMPLGERDALRDGSNYLDQVVNRYSSTIAAMFFGHTHVDHFEVSYSDYKSRNAGNALATSYIAPSLTPTSGMPSFRVYDVDPVTFGVLDATTYIADMDNEAFQTSGPVWTKLYSAKEAYGKAVKPPVTDAKAELTPAFWHRVTEGFEADEGLFDAFISRKSRGWNVATCRGKCKDDEICQLRAGRAEDNCFKPKLGIHLERRDGTTEHGEHDECGVPVTVSVLAAIIEDEENLAKFKQMVDRETELAGKAVET
ncbi:hypothetical protein HIM_08840 [Hirsutella minnesotensis 3608]|uniref:Sphingomyelin phosphodiesterase n=1 Tax=Hirsutella minnesotensis 3608 TaxID=1043627 RepID=A0A0F7ZM68_9HYPO|nr:hypothetical protein HIM_08840 [Hirsutella minnesotensis 3608]